MSNYEEGKRSLRVPRIVAVTDIDLLNNQEEERRNLIAFYFTMGIRFEFIASSFSDHMKKAYRAYMKTINSYRETVQKNDEYADIAIAYGFPQKALKQIHPSTAFSLSNLGLICSENPKDVKFVLKATRTFVQKAFPGIKKEMERLQDALRKRRMSEDILKQQPEVAAAILKDPDGLSSFAELPELIVSGMKKPFNTDARAKKKENIYSICIGSFLLGEEALPFLKTLYGIDNEISADDFVEAMRWFPINFGNIYYCAEEYWSLLLCSTWVAKYPTVDREMLQDMVDTQILTIFKNRRENESVVVKQYDELVEQYNDMKAVVVDATEAAHLGADIKELQSQLTEAEGNYQAESKRASNLTNQVEQYRCKLEQTIARAETAEQLLKGSQQNVQQLNNDLIEAYADSNFFYEPEEEEESSPRVLSGLRQRLGEENFAFLRNKTILVVGGHINTHTSLRELFPRWEFVRMDDAKAVQKGNISSYDAVCVMTSYCSHSLYDHAVNLAKAAQTLLILCPKNSAFGVCDRILQFQF